MKILIIIKVLSFSFVMAGVIFSIGPFYQKLIIDEEFIFSHLFIGFGLLMIGGGGWVAHDAYNGIDNENQIIGAGFGVIIAVIGSFIIAGTLAFPYLVKWFSNLF